MKESSGDQTVVHEILHHLERMMPADVQAAIRTTLLDQQKRSDQQLDIAIGILGATLLMMVFVVLG